MTREEIIAANPLKDFLLAAYVRLHGNRSKQCPRKTHEGDDVSVDFDKNIWNCHACGIGGSFIDWEMERDGVTAADVLRKYGTNGHDAHTPAVPAKRGDPAPAPPVDLSAEWRTAVDAFTDEYAAKLVEWRDYSPGFVAWLKERALIGVYKGNLALPVHGDGGAVVAFHVRATDGSKWFYHPNGTKTRPLLIGAPKSADTVLVFESQWDAFAILDKLPDFTGETVPAAIVTRGAGNGKLVRGLVKRGAVLLVFKQNDETKDGKNPADTWLADVVNTATAAGATVRHVITPAEYKDANDWTRGGGTAVDIVTAMENAVEVKPPKSEEETAAVTAFESALVTSGQLHQLPVTPRRFIVKPFLKEGDLGFIYAKRGDGKTWLTMLLAEAAATGGKAGSWEADGCWTVLYADGEMPVDESKRRDKVLGGARDNLIWLHHDIYFERTGRSLNLTDPLAQAALTEIILRHGVRVLVLDNLSCLFYGMAENDADSWEMVLPWLLDLRRRKVAVVIVAHAGRSGQTIRGTSRREDQAFWVLKLERKEDAAENDRHELRFTSLFTKNRNATEDQCPPMEWTISADGEGAATVTAKPINGVELLVSWVQAGLESAKDIAEEMHVSKGQVSKLAKKAARLGLIVIENRSYRATKDAK